MMTTNDSSTITRFFTGLRTAGGEGGYRITVPVMWSVTGE
jgi:hypothetical protein